MDSGCLTSPCRPPRDLGSSAAPPPPTRAEHNEELNLSPPSGLLASCKTRLNLLHPSTLAGTKARPRRRQGYDRVGADGRRWCQPSAHATSARPSPPPLPPPSSSLRLLFIFILSDMQHVYFLFFTFYYLFFFNLIISLQVFKIQTLNNKILLVFLLFFRCCLSFCVKRGSSASNSF